MTDFKLRTDVQMCKGDSRDSNLALVNVDFAEPAGEPWQAGAGEVVDAVDAGRPILTFVSGALVDVDLAVHT